MSTVGYIQQIHGFLVFRIISQEGYWEAHTKKPYSDISMLRYVKKETALYCSAFDAS